MTDFDRWLTFIVGDLETITDEDVRNGLAGEEGGWNQNDPMTDPPGQNPTFRGIEFDEWRDWMGNQALTQAQFRATLTRTQIGQLTSVRYWHTYRVYAVLVGPSVLYADGVFNGGGIENLQVTMNMLCPPFPPLKTDNVFGELTQAAMAKLNSIPAEQIIATYALAAEARYRELAKQPRFAPNLAGWLGRLGRCTALARQLAAGAAVT